MLIPLVLFFFDVICAYNFSLPLSAGYIVSWKIESSEIFLAIQAPTTGWVAFGLAEPTSGSMPGSDIVQGAVTSGAPSAQDYYAIAKTTPLLDDCQNWKLIHAQEKDGTTTIEIKRELVTNDPQDRPITRGGVRVVWAYSQTGVDGFIYHGTTRGTAVIDFFGGQLLNTSSELESLRADPSILHFDLLTNNSIPPQETTYLDQQFSFPLDREYHIVAFEMLIDPAASKYLHHLVLAGKYEEDVYPSLIWAWAPGVGPLVLPQDVGYRTGNSSEGLKTLIIQTHYDNPYLDTNKHDMTVLRVYYTASLRALDAGTLQVGDPQVSNPLIIPTGLGVTDVEYSCPSECTSEWPSVTVFGLALHMHKHGAQIRLVQNRNETVIREDKVEFWDFKFQHYDRTNWTIQPGDRLNLHCRYRQSRTGTIKFGQSSSDEMCMAFVSYYPRMRAQFQVCGYAYRPDASRNFTICPNHFPLTIGNNDPFNPIVRDSWQSEWDELRFGTPLNDSVCSPGKGMSPHYSMTAFLFVLTNIFLSNFP